jgi:hypothetical protein
VLSPVRPGQYFELYSLDGGALGQALAYGIRKVSFICLWNRQAGDGPGGTKHLHDAVVQGSGKAYLLDTTELR